MKAKLAYPYGRPTAKGLLKSVAEDFFVDEQLGFEPSGNGEHLFLQVEKTGLTTAELISRVAGDFGIRPGNIGYSGLKDKIAVTRQWLSLHMPGQILNTVQAEADSYVIVRQAWHNRKLRPGTHRSNRFRVLIREIGPLGEGFYQQLEAVKNRGMANYFGLQRFGADADNVQQALKIFGNARKTRKLSRNRKSLYLSSLRSELFNQILSTRIEAGIWDEPLEGDVFMLSGSQSIFQCAVDDTILARYRDFDISSTVSLYGSGSDKLSGAALALEARVFAENPQTCQCLDGLGVKRHKRAIRIKVSDLVTDYQPKKQLLAVEVVLPRGSYLTSLLDHLIDTAIQPDF